MRRPLRIVSAFSGIGGLDLAVEHLTGGTIVAHIENDPDAARVLSQRWPTVPNLGDITATDDRTAQQHLLRWAWADLAPVDVLCAGFPCEDLSYAGRGAGIKEGTRSGLWSYLVDAVRVLRPRVVLLENVAAIVGRRPGLDVVLADLAEARFDVEWVSNRASDSGAAHHRARWFAAAYPEGRRSERRRPSDQGAHNGSRPRDRREGPAHPDRLEPERGRGPGVVAGPQRPPPREGLQRQRDGQAARAGRAVADPDGPRRLDTRPDGPDRPSGAGAPGQPDRPGHGAPDPDGDGLARVATLDRPHRSLDLEHGDHPDRRGTDNGWGEYGPAIDRWAAILGRPAPAPTVDGRRLSPSFVEWLMGLPDGWTDVPGLSRNDRLAVLGRAVVPHQAIAAYAALDIGALLEDVEQ